MKKNIIITAAAASLAVNIAMANANTKPLPTATQKMMHLTRDARSNGCCSSVTFCCLCVPPNLMCPGDEKKHPVQARSKNQSSVPPNAEDNTCEFGDDVNTCKIWCEN